MSGCAQYIVGVLALYRSNIPLLCSYEVYTWVYEEDSG